MSKNYLKKINLKFSKNFTKYNNFKKIYKKYNLKTKNYIQKIKKNILISGRIINFRIIGKASFIKIININKKIQIYISSNIISYKKYKKIIKWNLGDIIEAFGTIFKTNTGELSIKCKKIKRLKKIIKKIPNKFHGLLNKEKCYRQRYLDLIANKTSRKKFLIRFKLIKLIRKFMHKINFIEVETPIIQNIPGGATAKPFVTHHNTLKKSMYLRISPELYLKQLIIGGFERIFEINKNFRNEGLSKIHHPEFTMMELYMTYSNYKDLINLIKNLLNFLSIKIFNTNIIKYKNNIFNFKKKYKIISMIKSICLYYPNIQLHELYDIKKIKKITNFFNIKIYNNWGIGRIQNEIFEKKIIHHLIQPTFITHYPTEISPLAKKNKKNKLFTDRFELFINGIEICNGFSELNNSKEQKKRFIQQIKNQKSKYSNKIKYDKNYIKALKYALPPTSGLGLGIDRLVMLFTNSKNIKDIILFPMLKSTKKK